MNVHVDGKWRPIAGSGNSTTVTNKYTSDPNAPMLNENNFNNVLNVIDQESGFNPANLTDEQLMQEANELKSHKFATPKQGNAVLVDYNLEDSMYTFQCDDGSIITYNGEQFFGLRPDIDGYLIWKTTRDKLPVRESQEETDLEEPNPGGNTTKSVKSGLLGSVPPPDPSTEGVYTVINNNTGEIVDPLELHKLTNVIWYNYYGGYYPFYLHDVADFYSQADAITNNDISISTWVSMRSYAIKLTYIKVDLFYDYTLQPNSMSKIQTTYNSTVSDIDDFFNY